MEKKRNKKGFTLAELLIVVAIIAVLVAIAIPIFTSQLDKARCATDTANVRSYVAERVVDALDAEGTSVTITKSQLQAVCTKGSTVSIDGNVITISKGDASNSFGVDSDVSLTNS